MNKFPDVAALVPHEAPMILINRVIDVAEITIHCQVDICSGGMFFDRHINGTPGWVGLEFMAQTIAAWSGYHASLKGEPSPVGFLLGSRRYSCECDVFMNHQVLDIYAEQLMESDGMGAFMCRIECDGETIASSQLNAFVPSADKLEEMLKGKENE